MDSSRKRSRTQFEGSTDSQENDTDSDNDSQSSVNQSQVGSNVIPTDPGPGKESSDYDTDDEESSDYDTESSYYETDDEDEDFLGKMLRLLGKLADVSPLSIQRHQERKALRERTLSVFQARREEIERLTRHSDGRCIEAFKMDMNAFALLCELLRTKGGLVPKGQVGIEEQVATFVHMLAHPRDNRFLQDGSWKSGMAFGRNSVMHALLEVEEGLLAKPEHIAQGCTDSTWKWFKCIVVGWEGRAQDARVLRHAVNNTSLKVPVGNYYLVDRRYANAPGFLAPYRGVRYHHLKDWGKAGLKEPENYKEFFNMKHAEARLVIERAFGLLKKRWPILGSPSDHPVTIQGKIIMACCLLHNFIRSNMTYDPEDSTPLMEEHLSGEENPGVAPEYIDTVCGTAEWTAWRDALAQEMFDEWRRNTDGA